MASEEAQGAQAFKGAWLDARQLRLRCSCQPLVCHGSFRCSSRLGRYFRILGSIPGEHGGWYSKQDSMVSEARCSLSAGGRSRGGALHVRSGLLAALHVPSYKGICCMAFLLL